MFLHSSVEACAANMAVECATGTPHLSTTARLPDRVVRADLRSFKPSTNVFSSPYGQWWVLWRLLDLTRIYCQSTATRVSANTGTSTCAALWTAKWNKHTTYLEGLEQLELASKTNLSRWNGKRAFDMYEPEWVCESEVRVGPEVVNVGDGPKFVCGLENLKEEENCLVYSIGSGYRFQFEEGIRKHAPNCEFHVFDGTMDLSHRALPPELEPMDIHFHNWNIATKSEAARSKYPSKTLEDVLQQLNHAGKTIQIFKIDCEGCEYTVLPHLAGLIEDNLLHVGQIQVEVHGINAKKIQTLFQRLRKAGFIIFHKERNQWGCQGYSCVEYALLAVSTAQKDFQSSHCPDDLFFAPIGKSASSISMSSTTPFASSSKDNLKERFEQQCTAWKDSLEYLNEAEHEGGLVYNFGLGDGGFGNKLRSLRFNFFVSLLLKKRFFIVGVDGVDIVRYFKPNLYDWMLPSAFNSSIKQLPCFSCPDLASNRSITQDLPLFITLRGCSTAPQYSGCNIGEILRRNKSLLSEESRNEFMKLWNARHCFLQSMLAVTDNVYSTLPQGFFSASHRIGLHVRWGDFYLKSFQTDSVFKHQKDRRVEKKKVMLCLKRLCGSTTIQGDSGSQKSVYLYTATDMPQKLYFLYKEMYNSTLTTELPCSSNVDLLSNRYSYHTGKNTSTTSIHNMFLIAVADFLALSRSEMIVAPGRSSFSEQAAMFGLVKLKSTC